MGIGRQLLRAAVLATACLAATTAATRASAKPPVLAKAPPPPFAKKPIPAPAPPPAPPVSDPGLEAYRAKMVANVPAAAKMSAALAALAKRPAPRDLSSEQKKTWDAQTKLLVESSAKLASLKTKMEAVLAKPRASVSELAQTNYELVQIQEAVAEESRKLAEAAAAARDRHAAVLAAMKA
jgi:hypothetical protein